MFLSSANGSAGQLTNEGSLTLTRYNVPAPWYRQGPVKTTFNYCDMCPWCCGIVVKSVNGRVVKIDGKVVLRKDFAAIEVPDGTEMQAIHLISGG